MANTINVAFIKQFESKFTWRTSVGSKLRNTVRTNNVTAQLLASKKSVLALQTQKLVTAT